MLILTWVQAISTTFPNGSCVCFNLLTAVLLPPFNEPVTRPPRALPGPSRFTPTNQPTNQIPQNFSCFVNEKVPGKWQMENGKFVVSNKFLSFSYLGDGFFSPRYIFVFVIIVENTFGNLLNIFH